MRRRKIKNGSRKGGGRFLLFLLCCPCSPDSSPLSFILIHLSPFFFSIFFQFILFCFLLPSYLSSTCNKHYDPPKCKHTPTELPCVITQNITIWTQSNELGRSGQSSKSWREVWVGLADSPWLGLSNLGIDLKFATAVCVCVCVCVSTSFKCAG